MRPKKRISVLVLVLSVQLAGCEADYTVVQSSSQGGVDYEEEPLTEWSREYSVALDTSNKFAEAFSAGRLKDLRALFDSRLDKDVSDLALKSMREQVIASYGQVVEYKPMQWGFAVGSDDDEYFFSVKILVHEKQQVYYILKFETDSAYDQIMGFRIRAREDGQVLSQIARNAFKQSRESQ